METLKKNHENQRLSIGNLKFDLVESVERRRVSHRHIATEISQEKVSTRRNYSTEQDKEIETKK